MVLKIILFALGLLAIVTTLLPLLRAEAWWIRIWDFPRLQIVVVLAVTLALTVPIMWGGGPLYFAFIALLAGCLAYQAYMMFPYTRLASKQVEWSRDNLPDSNISLIFANVLIENRETRGLIRIIEEADPDMLLTVETDNWWHEQLAFLADKYPHHVLQPQENGYGMLLYSKLELIGEEVKFLIEDGIPSIHAEAVLRSGEKIVIRCLHPRPPFPTEDESSIGRDAELLVVGKEIKEVDAPIIVFGDLNDVSWSKTNYLFQNISGMLDPRVGRGFYHTFHANYPFLRFPLDHFFHSKHFRLNELKRLPYFGSDHFPVYISLSLESDAEIEQDELHPDPSEKREADRKIQKAT